MAKDNDVVQLSKEELREIIKEVVAASDDKRKCCDVCELKPYEHRKQHEQMVNLLGVLDETAKNTRATVVKIVTTFFIGAIIVGTLWLAGAKIQEIFKAAGA